MPRRSTNTRERIIRAATELFYAQGYERTGMAEILKKARANSGSFYFFFRSKEDLLLAVLDWYLANLEPILIRPIYEQSSDPVERIFLLLDGYRQKVLMTDFDFSCPIGRLALEIDPAKRKVQQKIAANFNGWTEAVRKCLEAAADRFPAGTDHEQLARLVLTVMEGAVMQARTHRNIGHFDASIAQLKNYFEYLQAKAGPGNPTPGSKRRTS